MVVLTIMGVLVSIAAPTYQKAVEQSRVDIAAANLRTIWAAQRYYHLEYHVYASNWDALDLNVLSADSYYLYTISSNADGSATASRVGSTVYTGTLAITSAGDNAGIVTGAIQISGIPSLSAGH
jgi:Tfp pilus assembly protein PilE